MLKVIICDDNEVFLKYISKKIHEIAMNNNLNVNIKTYLSGKSMLFDLEDHIHSVDILFIDVLMDDMTGIDVSKKMREYGSNAQIIFITSVKSHVFEALDVMPLHYLIKSEIDDRVIESILMKAVTLSNKYKKSMFLYKVGHSKKTIKCEDIVFFEINNRVVTMHCSDKTEEVFYSTMDNLENGLDKSEFIRIHRSYIVNITKVASINSKNVICRDGTILPVGRKYTGKLKNQYSKFILENI